MAPCPLRGLGEQTVLRRATPWGRAQSWRKEGDLLRRDAEPVERVPGHLDRELFLSEDDLVRARLAQVVRGLTRVRPRDNAEALVRSPRVFHNATRRLRVAQSDN